MATKKDLVEAYSFSRRRLVTAFVSGAPGGREVEPSRPGRTIIGGVALAVLVAAGGAVAGILGGSQDIDLTQAALVTEKESGALYVILPDDPAATTAPDTAGSAAGTADTGPVLRPVVNVTSAMLLLGPALQRLDVPHSEIATLRRGAQIGILQAPSTPPRTDSLIQTGWTACTGPDADGTDHGIQLDVTTTPHVVTDQGASMLVRVGSEVYVVAEAQPTGVTAPRGYAYRVPRQRAGDTTDTMLTRMGTQGYDTATPVSRDWLNLFLPGGRLGADSFDVPKIGKPYTGPGDDSLPPSYAKRASYGDYFLTGGGSAQQALVLVPGGYAQLDPFATAVYRNAVTTPPQPLGTVSGLPGTRREVPLREGTFFPTALPHQVGVGDLCAQLDTSDPDQPRAVLATTLDATAVATDVKADKRSVRVDSGHGAVVYAASGDVDDDLDDVAQPYVVDESGVAYQLDGTPGGDDPDARTQLGYADVPAVVVPDTWVKLFHAGVPLSVDQARCPPTLDDGSAKSPASQKASCAP